MHKFYFVYCQNINCPSTSVHLIWRRENIALRPRNLISLWHDVMPDITWFTSGPPSIQQKSAAHLWALFHFSMATFSAATVSSLSQMGVIRVLTSEFLHYRQNAMRNHQSDSEEVRWVSVCTCMCVWRNTMWGWVYRFLSAVHRIRVCVCACEREGYR